MGWFVLAVAVRAWFPHRHDRPDVLAMLHAA